MRQKIANLIVTALEVGCITGLTGIAISAEWKRHKAEKALERAEWKCTVQEFCNFMDQRKIKDLKKELEELKKKEKA